MSLPWRGVRPLIVVCTMLLAGCGGQENPFDTVPISGTVTYADGSPIDAAVVIVKLYPQDVTPVGEKFPREAETQLAPDGTFANIITAGFGDRVIVGRHKVVVEAYNENSTPRPEAIAAVYGNPQQTPLEVTVTADGENVFPLTVEKGP